MKKTLCFSLLSFLTFGLFAQSMNVNQGGTTQENYFVELPYENIRGKIIITIELAAKKRRFLLDTGAPTVISTHLYNELMPPALSKMEISDVNGKKDSLLLVQLPALMMGQIAFDGIPAIVMQENPITECFKVDGFIGSNVLRNSIIRFNSKENTVQITNDLKKLSTANAKESDIIIDRQSSPFFTIHLGKNITETLLFDSGSDEFYSMSNTRLKKYKKSKGVEILGESYGSNTMGLYGHADNSMSAKLFIPSLLFNQIDFQNIVTETTDDRTSRIGSQLLNYGILTINYRDKKSYFEPFTQPVSFNETFWDLDPTFSDNKLVVGKLWSKDLKKHISIGDQIINIGETDTENINFCELLLNSPLANMTKASLRIKTQKGEIKTVEINRR